MDEDVNKHLIARIVCKYCSSTNTVKYGVYKNTQRYWCKSCKRKFKADESLYHSKVSASYISSALTMFYCNNSIAGIRSYFIGEHDYHVSQSVIYRWIQKYSQIANVVLSKYKPEAGKIWLLVKSNQTSKSQKHQIIIDIFDNDSIFLFNTFLIRNNNPGDLKKEIDHTTMNLGKYPDVILSNLIKPDNGKQSVLIQDESISRKISPLVVHPDKLEIISNIQNERNKFIKRFKKEDSISQFMVWYKNYHNFFKYYHILGGKSPGQAAGIAYSYRSWADLIRE